MSKFSLKQAVATLEDSIIVLSGPALAISGIIAGVDLVTGGNILRSLPQMTLAWAITLLLSLDFNVLALGVRAHRVWLSSHSTKRKVLEIALMVAIAAGVSYVSIQMQSVIARTSAEGITIDRASVEMGVNLIALTWERSTLVLVLIFLSGWLREHDTQKAETPAPVQAAQPSPNFDELLLKLDSMHQQRMEALYQRTVETVKISIAEATNPQIPVVTPAQLAIPAPETGLDNAPESDGKNGKRAVYEGQFTSKEQAVADAVRRLPGASIEAIAQEAGCSVRTAQRWITKLQEADS